MKPIFVFCEGAHDIAFFSQLLNANGAKPYTNRLSEYEPKIVSDLLINQYKSRNVEKGYFRSKGTNKGAFVSENPPIIQSAWQIDEQEKLILFFACHGGDNRSAVESFLRGIVELAGSGAPDLVLPGFGVIFTADADDQGIEKRRADWVEHFSSCLNDQIPDFGNLAANDPSNLVRNGDYSAGCIVFAKEKTDRGTLEDILWPHIENGYGARLRDAAGYIENHGVEGTIVAKSDSKRRKASITIAGQVDSPGCALSVILRDTNALDVDSLVVDEACKKCWEILSAI